MTSVRTAVSTTTNPLVLVVLTWALLWGFGAGQLPLGAGAPSTAVERPTSAWADVDADAVWSESYSARFPGCVALVLWPAEERPRALIVRQGDGRVRQVAPEAIEHTTGNVIGACR